MRNGLYSVHIQMGDGVKGRASGVIVLRDGKILGGDPYFWSVGTYTFKAGSWKGDLSPTSTHPIAIPPRGRFLAAGRSRPAFREPGRTTVPRFSAPRWWAAAASVFARHCAGWPIKRWRPGSGGCKPLPIAPGALFVLATEPITPSPKRKRQGRFNEWIQGT